MKGVGHNLIPFIITIIIIIIIVIIIIIKPVLMV